MPPIDYDTVAAGYDRRYELQAFDGIEETVRRFVSAALPPAVVEVGCGTGHWLALLGDDAGRRVGIDPASEMLERGRANAPGAALVRARAEEVPLAAGTVDRILCINALHHFRDLPQFFREARRILRAGAGLLNIGLDPHTGTDRWWIYDYFPSARRLDRLRYPASAELRRTLAACGFDRTETAVAQHIPATVPFHEAVEMGLLERTSTSQLMVIESEEYERGVARLHREQPVLTADLRLHATFGWRG